MQGGTAPSASASSTLTPEDAKRFELNRLRGVYEFGLPSFIPLNVIISQSQTKASGRRGCSILVGPECKPEATPRRDLCDFDLGHLQAAQARLASRVLL